MLSIPKVVYQFECSICLERYIGMTDRRLGDRGKEHIPAWIYHDLDKDSKSSIANHLKKHRQNCDPVNCFKIIYRARSHRVLRFAEAVAIKRIKPSLNIVKDFDVQLKLPWS